MSFRRLSAVDLVADHVLDEGRVASDVVEVALGDDVAAAGGGRYDSFG